MILQGYVVGGLGANCYVVGDEDNREVLVIDPGGDAPQLLEQFRQHEFRVTAVLATHHHSDHTGGVQELLDALPEAQFYMHHLDYAEITNQSSRARAGLGRESTPPREPDRFLEHGDVIEIGGQSFTALHCPGHTPGSLCVYRMAGASGEGMVFTGDVLFQGSIGRTDFAGGDSRALIASIHQHLLTLPPKTIVFPGHNQPTTIGDEYALNPFLRDPDLAAGLDTG